MDKKQKEIKQLLDETFLLIFIRGDWKIFSMYYHLCPEEYKIRFLKFLKQGQTKAIKQASKQLNAFIDEYCRRIGHRTRQCRKGQHKTTPHGSLEEAPRKPPKNSKRDVKEKWSGKRKSLV